MKSFVFTLAVCAALLVCAASSASATFQPKLLWNVTTNMGISRRPSTYERLVFVGGDSLKGYDIATGKLDWQWSDQGQNLNDKPLILPRRRLIVVGTINGDWIAINLDTKKQMWKVHISGIAQGGAADFGEELVFFGGGGNLYAVWAANGTEAWLAPASGMMGRPYVVAPKGSGAQMVLAGTQSGVAAFTLRGEKLWESEIGLVELDMTSDGVAVYAGGPDGLNALSLVNGKPAWITGSGVGTGGEAKVDGDRVYVPIAAGNSATYYCLSAKDGTVLWSHKASGYAWSQPVITGHTVIFGNNNGQLIAFDTRSGKLLWNYMLAGADGGAILSTLTGKAVLFVPTWMSVGSLSAIQVSAGSISEEICLDDNCKSNCRYVQVAEGCERLASGGSYDRKCFNAGGPINFMALTQFSGTKCDGSSMSTRVFEPKKCYEEASGSVKILNCPVE